MDQSTCFRCGSKALVPNGVIFDRGLFSKGLLEVGLAATSTPNLSKGEVAVATSSVICATCGFVEMHVTDPARLGGAYRAMLRDVVEKARRTGATPNIKSCPQCLAVLASGLECGVCDWAYAVAKDSGGTA